MKAVVLTEEDIIEFLQTRQRKFMRRYGTRIKITLAEMARAIYRKYCTIETVKVKGKGEDAEMHVELMHDETQQLLTC